MLSIDEVIARERQQAKKQRSRIGTWGDEYSNKKCEVYAEYHEQLAEWLEELKAIKSDGFTDNLLNMGFTKGYSKALEELKVIKEMDLSIPQHFTKEQSDWIKKYCINRNREFYNKALDDAKSVILQTLDNEILVDTLHLRLEQLKEQSK